MPEAIEGIVLLATEDERDRDDDQDSRCSHRGQIEFDVNKKFKTKDLSFYIIHSGARYQLVWIPTTSSRTGLRSFIVKDAEQSGQSMFTGKWKGSG